MNICLITADGMRYDALRCNGNALARSPHLDALSAEGVRFSRGYCTQPICMPCRSTLMTGRWPSAHGVWQNGVPLDPDAPNLATALRDAGWSTQCYGKFHFRPWLPDLTPDENAHRPEYHGDGPYYGFDKVRVADHSREDRYYDWLAERHPQWLDLARDPRGEAPADAVNAWKSRMPNDATKTAYIADLCIDAIAHRDRSRPTFLWASFIDPHHPYNPPSPHCDYFDDVDFPQPPHNDGPPADLPEHYHWWAKRLRDMWGFDDGATRDWLNVRRMYQGKVSHVDEHIGRVMAALKQHDMWDDTLVVYLSDHGTMLGDYGFMQIGEYSQECLVRVPLIIKTPNGASGATCDALTSTADIMPTLLQYAGVDVPSGVQGLDLQPLLADPSATLRDELLIEQRYGENPPEGFNTIVTDRHKLSLFSNGREGELYDLEDDPQELNNCFHAPTHAALQCELTHRLAALQQRCADPLPRRVACW